jgi:DNA-directed RNA polymerase sigma subunit (sigma70/sigma32)
MGNQTVAYFRTLIKSSLKLNPKEKDILVERLRRKTLKKIGRRYKVSGEWIRQIEKKALIKLMKKIYQMLLFEK